MDGVLVSAIQEAITNLLGRIRGIFFTHSSWPELRAARDHFRAEQLPHVLDHARNTDSEDY